MKRLITILFVAILSPVAAAEDAWTLTTADLKSESVAVKAFDGDKGLTVTPLAGGADRTVAVDRFVDLARPVAAIKPVGAYDLHLVGGDHINGDPAGMKGESIVWKTAAAGDVAVPLTRIAGIGKAGARFLAERRRDDLVVFTNGDTARGTLMDLTPEQIVVKTDAGNTPVPFASLSRVALASTVQPSGKNLKPTFRIQVDDGSVLSATTAKIADGKLEATIGGAARSIDLARVAGIEQVNGPVAFLSTRQPSANVYTPFLGSDQRFVARMNSDFEGGPIRFRDRVYPRAIAAHSYSKITWPLDGSYSAFRTRYALDPKASGGNGGDVTVRIKLDDKVVHEKTGVRPGQLFDPVIVDLGSAKELTLEVDYGAMIDSNDRLNWLEPALLKFKPE
ncbi:NPCBM/NEW2 domain-containing protein [Humisphaera borealis]|uniref:NPCBM/NEW2 domain-containing protein n=1 Tax=Humisphaera borealis TaxID=2807512 RepID=A0A7M2WWN5_9BACT|nr:NPCBM/NEW2 domain-containing protein [Humisphaera borealis]QOV89947.1 NPCBM/NEW2 domain-containing protein [Humisphaera borealis]